MKKFMWVDESGRLPSETALSHLERLNNEFDDSGECGYAFVFVVPPFADSAVQADQSSVALVRFNDGPGGYGGYGLYEEVISMWDWPQYPTLDTPRRREQSIKAIESHLLKMLGALLAERKRDLFQWRFRRTVEAIQLKRKARGLPMGGSTSTAYIHVKRQFDALEETMAAKTATIEAQIAAERAAIATDTEAARERQRRTFADRSAAPTGGIL